MDAGMLTLSATVIAVGLTIVVSIMVALFALTRQSNRLEDQMRASNTELRAEMRDLANRVSELGDRLGERISEVEREQARLEGANSLMRAQAHTHAPPTALEDD